MKDGAEVVKLLDEAGNVLAAGKFSEYDLTFIKEVLERFLDATNKTISKIEKE